MLKFFVGLVVIVGAIGLYLLNRGDVEVPYEVFGLKRSEQEQTQTPSPNQPSTQQPGGEEEDPVLYKRVEDAGFDVSLEIPEDWTKVIVQSEVKLTAPDYRAAGDGRTGIEVLSGAQMRLQQIVGDSGEYDTLDQLREYVRLYGTISVPAASVREIAGKPAIVGTRVVEGGQSLDATRIGEAYILKGDGSFYIVYFEGLFELTFLFEHALETFSIEEL